MHRLNVKLKAFFIMLLKPRCFSTCRPRL